MRQLNVILTVLILLLGTSAALATPLIDAIGRGDMGKMRALIKHGANVNAKEDGITPLFHLVVVSISANLSINDGDVNAKTKRDLIAKYTEMAKLLIENGADVNVKIDGGTMPLHIASVAGITDIVKLLIEHGADINAKLDGDTPLSLAIKSNNVDCAAIIKAAGGVE